MDQEKIEERRQKSIQYYAKRKAKQERLKEGRAYYRDQKMELFKMKIGDVIVSAAVMPGSSCDHCNYNEHECIVWCCCSPKDTYSLKIARGLLGYRAKMKHAGWIYTSSLKSRSEKERVYKLTSFFINDAYGDHLHIPPRLQKAILNEMRAEKDDN